MTVISCIDVSKNYLHHRANEDVSFSVKENTITGVIGRNGAGKTTLLKMIAGYLRPTSGDITVFQKQPYNSLTVSYNRIFVDDQMVFPASFNLTNIIDMCQDFYPNFDRKFAYNLIDYFELPLKRTQYQLSKGQKSSLHFIVGLAARCPLTIFDEPTTGMDSTVRKDFYRVLLKDYITHPRTILLSSHQIQEIEHLLEDVLILDHGKLLMHESIDDLRAYALKVSGDAHLVKKVTAERDIIYEERIGNNELNVIIKNDGSFQTDDDRISTEGLPVHELLSYVTKKRKGGIDDVFHK